MTGTKKTEAPARRRPAADRAQADRTKAGRAQAGRTVARQPGRLSSEDRAQSIVREAIRFFAEAGFAGSTRDLAKRLGITQALLYKHFPSKQDLVDRVFRDVFLNRLDPAWQQLLRDRSQPLAQRLITFYTDFRKVQFSAEWIRLYFFSALAGIGYNERWISMFEDSVFPVICTEIRALEGIESTDTLPIQSAEMEFIWGMHAAIFYHGVRRHLYRVRVYQELDETVEVLVQAFLAGVGPFYTARAMARDATLRPRAKGAARA